MSLTSFLASNKDVREQFRQEFKKPKFTSKMDLLAPPLTKRYMLIGTAFDYLMRFYLKYHNPNAITRTWVAELSIKSPMSPLLDNVVIDSDTREVIEFTETNLTRKVQQIIEQAKKVYKDYLSSGKLSDELIKTALHLARLDAISRSGFIDENIGTVYEEEVADLQKLISIVNPNLFKVQEICLLNPAFGKGSKLVGGADADLFIDGMLIDIKTTKMLEFTRSYFDQLIGYYVLHEIGGIGDLKSKTEISKVGIYFSRHAYLYVLEIQDIINRNTFPNFIRWFRERVAKKM